MSSQGVPLKLSGFGQTRRTDAWWTEPLIVFIGLLTFLVVANLRVFEGDNYFSGHGKGNESTNYLTPFYSPLMFEAPGKAATHHAWLEKKPEWLPAFVSAAALILIFPAGFRFTCYYYRGAYYKAFWADPPSCAVAEPRSNYLGEQKFPLIFQNIHRYFVYFAVAFLFILAWDAAQGFRFKNAAGEWRFGIGVGSLVLVLNVVLLSAYTLGCHSIRHLIGGKKDCVSENATQHKLYECVSCLNRKHMLFAWMSLIWVLFTDCYVRFCSTGTWSDLHVVF